jgi:hypothetical protein
LTRDPASLAGALALALGPALVRHLSPLGLASPKEGQWEAFYQVAFLGAVVLAALQLRAIERLRWPISRLGPLRGRTFEMLLLVFGTAALLAPALLAQALLEASALPVKPLGATSLVVALLHLGALAGWTLALPVPAGLRPVLLLAGAWVLPALLPGSALLAATAISDQGSLPPPSGAVASMLALLLSALLVARSPRART